LESDWTQLQDVPLTSQSRNQWVNWRESLRNLDRFSVENISEYKEKLNKLEEERGLILIDYSSNMSLKDVESGKQFLHQKLVEYYNERISFRFSPNLEEKYQEALDIIAITLSRLDDDFYIEDMNMNQLRGLISSLNPITDIDISKFPFFELTMRLKNFNINDTIIYLLDMKDQQYNFALQEEYNMLHYESKINFCESVEDLIVTKREIEMNYGH
jgi:hypothetical protein